MISKGLGLFLKVFWWIEMKNLVYIRPGSLPSLRSAVHHQTNHQRYWICCWSIAQDQWNFQSGDSLWCTFWPGWRMLIQNVFCCASIQCEKRITRTTREVDRPNGKCENQCSAYGRCPEIFKLVARSWQKNLSLHCREIYDYFMFISTIWAQCMFALFVNDRASIKAPPRKRKTSGNANLRALPR